MPEAHPAATALRSPLRGIWHRRGPEVIPARETGDATIHVLGSAKPETCSSSSAMAAVMAGTSSIAAGLTTPTGAAAPVSPAAPIVPPAPLPIAQRPARSSCDCDERQQPRQPPLHSDGPASKLAAAASVTCGRRNNRARVELPDPLRNGRASKPIHAIC